MLLWDNIHWKVNTAEDSRPKTGAKTSCLFFEDPIHDVIRQTLIQLEDAPPCGFYSSRSPKLVLQQKSARTPSQLERVTNLAYVREGGKTRDFA